MSKIVVIDGIEYKSLAEACRAFDINDSTVSSRICRGWSVEKAIKTKVKKTIEKEIKVADYTDTKGDRVASFSDMNHTKLAVLPSQSSIKSTSNKTVKRRRSLFSRLFVFLRRRKTHSRRQIGRYFA